MVENFLSSVYIPGGFLWSQQDKHQYLEIRANGTEVYYSGRDHPIVEEQEISPMVRADRPIPRQGMFFFEVSIVNAGSNKEVAVGICTRNTPLTSFPGWDPSSFGFHGDDGNIFCETDADPKYTPNMPFQSGDPIGVGLDFNSATLTFYSRQREIQRIQLQRHQMDQDYYPCIGISSPGAIVRLTMPIGGGSAPPPQGYQQSMPGGAYSVPQQPSYQPPPQPGYQAPLPQQPNPPAARDSGFLWSHQDKHQYLEIRGNGTEVYYSGSDHHIVEEQEMGPMVRADRPIPRQGMFFFEVSIVNVGRNKEVAVGICTRSTPLSSFPGWNPCSFGYHGDDGNIFCETDADPKYTPGKSFKSGDPIGVSLDFNSSTLTFYRKQKEIQRIQLQRHQMDQDYYPCIGISSPGAIVRLTMPVGGKIYVYYSSFVLVLFYYFF